MRKIAKILLCISCLLPLTCLVAFAEEVKLPDGSVVNVEPYYGVDDAGCPLDEHGFPDKNYYELFHVEQSSVDVGLAPFVEVYVPGMVFDHIESLSSISYGPTYGFTIGDRSGIRVGDVLVAYSDQDTFVIFDVTEVGSTPSSNKTILVPRTTIPLENFVCYSSSGVYYPIEPMNFVALIGDWIIGCFSTVALVLTGFASDNEWVTFFLLVIPLSGLIFSFVKSLIARR